MIAAPAAPVVQHTQYAPQQQQQATYQQAQHPSTAMPQQPLRQAVPAPAPQRAPGPPAQHPHQGLNGGWQSDQDYQERRKMIAKM
jgi:hypothetical protein